MCTFAPAVAVEDKETFNQLNRNAGAHKKQPLSNNAGEKNATKAFRRRSRWE